MYEIVITDKLTGLYDLKLFNYINSFPGIISIQIPLLSVRITYITMHHNCIKTSVTTSR